MHTCVPVKQDLLTVFTCLDKTGTVRIWDLGSGGVVNEYSETTPTTRRCPVSSLVFSSDNTLLVSSNHDNKISIRNMKALEQS